MSFTGVAEFLKDNSNTTQFALFGFVIVSLWLMERAATAQPTLEKLKHTSFNVLYMSAVAPIQLAMMLLCVTVAGWTETHHWGLVYLLPHAENPWIKYGLMFLVLDFLDYCYHFTAHHFAPLWRLHLLHHTDQAVDVSTTFREHPGETVVRTCYLTFWVLICGASIEVLMLRQTFETFANVSQHAVFRLPKLPARILGWLFVTPNLHHAHHHFERPGTNCNYGDVLSIWDRLFRTYYDLAGAAPVFGLDTHMGDAADRTLLRLLRVAASSRAFGYGAKLYRDREGRKARVHADLRTRAADTRPFTPAATIGFPGA